MKLTANTIIKLFVNSVGQDALKDFYEHNWDARKKEIQKKFKAEYDFDLIYDTDFQRVMDILNDFADWAVKMDYITTWDKFAILDLLIPYMKALQIALPEGIPEEKFIEYTIMYSICSAYRHSMQEALKSKDFHNDRNGAILLAIYQFNFYLPTYQYKKIVEPLEGVFDLFLALVKDKKKLFDFWDSKRFEIDENNSGDLKLLINRWTKTKKARPTWKVIKLFMNEDLIPDDNLIIQPFPDISGKVQYLTFRRKIFSAYFITNFFHYLREYELINEASVEMIQNGIRLFYRHFLVTNEPTVSVEEKQNPMFCMLYNFLFTDTMGIDFDKDTRFYFGI